MLLALVFNTVNSLKKLHVAFLQACYIYAAICYALSNLTIDRPHIHPIASRSNKDLAMPSWNTSQLLAKSATIRCLKERAPLQVCALANSVAYIVDNNLSSPTVSHCRRKSSFPSFLGGTQDDVYERALHNATTFDKLHHLDTKDKDTIFSSTPSSWRQRQIEITKQRPIKPYPKLPPNLIPPSPKHLPTYFPSYAHTGRVGMSQLPHDHVLLHDASSIQRMRKAAQLARRLLDYVCHPSIAKVGRTTEEIDILLHKKTMKHGAYPSPLNYSQFPKSVCSSINEVVCHGIPDTRPLELGDVVSFDVSCYIDGVHGDNCATIIVGDYDVVDEDDIEEFSWEDEDDISSTEDATSTSTTITTTKIIDGSQKDWPSKTNDIPQKSSFHTPEEEERFVTARRLVQAALESRDEGVKACKAGKCLSDIGGAIHAVVDAYGYDTVRHYRGHGISSDFHCSPFVKHFRNNDAMELLPGMIFTIEPMITEGSAECHEWADNWSVLTQDGGRAAQFEHTVLITEESVEVLTLP